MMHLAVQHECDFIYDTANFYFGLPLDAAWRSEPGNLSIRYSYQDQSDGKNNIVICSYCKKYEYAVWLISCPSAEEKITSGWLGRGQPQQQRGHLGSARGRGNY
ncbi:hypothetical protein HAX54_029106 [Datura stramonium]|uniref:NADP-dependent oxidoreductase domain-containing protein n=1 Tax=Datura stramonium TaxID=4076 RepID=A0ABS8RKX2_DATST|nr:hypothetical protein [Datura stramonium]